MCMHNERLPSEIQRHRSIRNTATTNLRNWRSKGQEVKLRKGSRETAYYAAVVRTLVFNLESQEESSGDCNQCKTDQKRFSH